MILIVGGITRKRRDEARAPTHEKYGNFSILRSSKKSNGKASCLDAKCHSLSRARPLLPARSLSLRLLAVVRVVSLPWVLCSKLGIPSSADLVSLIVKPRPCQPSTSSVDHVCVCERERPCAWNILSFAIKGQVLGLVRA